MPQLTWIPVGAHLRNKVAWQCQITRAPRPVQCRGCFGLQGYFAHKNQPPRRTLQQTCAQGPRVILGRGGVLMSKVPL